MNAAETIQAAIDRLEELSAESTPRPWHHWTDDLTGDVDLWHDQEVRSHIAGLGQFGDLRVYRDAELIVTLHRTIDAQLAILRADLALHELGFRDGDPGSWRNAALDLARAILGGAK